MTDPINPQAEELFQRLTVADPVDHDALPSANDTSAQHLLENTMNFENTLNSPSSENTLNSPSSEKTPNSPNPGRQVTDPVDASQFQFDHRSAPQRRSRGRGMLVGAAAAVLLLVGGVLVFSPDNTPSAVAEVHSAASTTLDADTARVTTEFSLNGTDGVEAGEVSGRFDASYADDDLSISVDLDELQFDGRDDAPSLDDLPITEARLVDDILYANVEGEWLAVDTEGLLGEVVGEIADPRTVLETVQELTETTEVGPADIDGVPTTHFQSVVDLGDESSLEQSGWMTFDGLRVDTDGEMTVDLYVDDDGVLRQLDLSGDVRDTGNSGEFATFEISTQFYDIGADFTIEAPEGVEPIDILEGLFSED